MKTVLHFSGWQGNILMAILGTLRMIFLRSFYYMDTWTISPFAIAASAAAAAAAARGHDLLCALHV